jgi:formate--tetrahydrofolate ligase
MKTDIEISNECKMLTIDKIISKLDINEEKADMYGKYKAKIKYDTKGNKIGKLILVTSINPTPYGEGKTTMSIGINDAINKLNYSSIVALREPSLGPVFGIKGGATGGGYSQVVPMEDINLHFTGDIHAITACNNLLCAAIDNHLYQGNELNLDPSKISFRRCLDINDRALRNVTVSKNSEFEREEKFDISVASEIMAIFCLATSLEDLKNKLSKIIIGYTFDDKPVYVSDLKITGALALLLKDAINPNLVQTLENNPAFIHGGPFANIAHGCNSIIATKMALSFADYVVTEAGFGSDLGAEKFLDIKCRLANIKPNCIVINSTIRSLKHNGYCPKEELKNKNLEYLEKGIENLKAHIDNMKLYTNNIIVCLNKFYTDTDEEIAYVKNYVENLNVEFEISESFAKGGEGAIELAKKIINICNNEIDFKYLYDLDETIPDKINKICKNIYHAKDIVYSEEVLNKIKNFEALGCNNYPVCIAKTQYSISDDPKKLGYPKDNTIIVKDIRVANGAGFIIVYTGNILTMPGLSKTPAYENMDISNEGIITGLF